MSTDFDGEPATTSYSATAGSDRAPRRSDRRAPYRIADARKRIAERSTSHPKEIFMIDIDPNTHREGWFKSWIPKASTAELKRLLTTPYGQDPAVSWRLAAELSRRDQQTRPEPAPGNPRPLPRVVRATSDAILDAARRRDEPGAEPTRLAAEIIQAGKRRRGEI
jgi:hypothetical protein